MSKEDPTLQQKALSQIIKLNSSLSRSRLGRSVERLMEGPVRMETTHLDFNPEDHSKFQKFLLAFTETSTSRNLMEAHGKDLSLFLDTVKQAFVAFQTLHDVDHGAFPDVVKEITNSFLHSQSKFFADQPEVKVEPKLEDAGPKFVSVPLSSSDQKMLDDLSKELPEILSSDQNSEVG